MNAIDLRRRQQLTEMLSSWFGKEGYEVSSVGTVYTGDDMPCEFDLTRLAEAIMDFEDGDRP